MTFTSENPGNVKRVYYIRSDFGYLFLSLHKSENTVKKQTKKSTGANKKMCTKINI